MQIAKVHVPKKSSMSLIVHVTDRLPVVLVWACMCVCVCVCVCACMYVCVRGKCRWHIDPQTNAEICM